MSEDIPIEWENPSSDIQWDFDALRFFCRCGQELIPKLSGETVQCPACSACYWMQLVNLRAG